MSTPALRVEGLTVKSPRGRTILELPELDVPAGTALGLRGASGAGKTTFIHALMGLAPGASGRVLWGERDLIAMAEADRAAFRRTEIGTIFQDFLLFDELSAAANASIQALFRPADERRAIEEAAGALLTDASLQDQARPVASFSGGERQRVALARALAHAPCIILADEPTASLPEEAGAALVTTLLDHVAARGATLILASHDEGVLARMDRVLTLDHGRVTDP